jgi:hypothetical protein
MGASKHTEAQIIAALKQVEAGRGVEDVGREYGVSKHTIYAMEVLCHFWIAEREYCHATPG